jgi:CubicO group peptidase (beta-lactamase class C family)
MLANEGKLSLTDDVRKYIPELPTYGKVITIDHLLRHTSGLRDYNGLLYLAGHFFEDYTNDDDALAIIVSQRNTNFDPGSKWDYSNTGFFLLPVIVQRVTGRRRRLAKARIFAPAGDDRHALPRRSPRSSPNRATPTSRARRGSCRHVQLGPDWRRRVNTNVFELAKWDANFDDAKVGGRALVDRTGGGRRQWEAARLRARALRRHVPRVSRVHHGGAWAGYRAMLMRFPDQGVAIGLTCNRGDANTQGRAERVADAILARAFKDKPTVSSARPAAGQAPSGATVDPAPYVGTYFSEEEQAALGVEAGSGAPVLSYSGRKIPLSRTADDAFSGMEGMINLTFADARQEARLSIAGRAAIAYRRADRAKPSASELASLVGTYRSPELLASWTIRQSGDTLYIKGRAVGESPMVPVIRDGFSSGTGFVRFTRSADGVVTGFEVSASRMKRIRFDR